MSLFGKRPSQATLPLSQRWRQVYDAGEIVLTQFSQAELDCVALDPASVPERERGAALMSVSPLLARLTAAPADPKPEFANPAQPDTGQGAAMLADAAARLEKRGFVRPGPPSPTSGTLTDELAAVAVDPANPGAVRPVTLVGDLALVTRMKTHPCWVAEAFSSPESTRPDPAEPGWQLVGRMYAAHRPSAVLVEAPSSPGSDPLPFTALWQPDAARLVGRWLGVDPAETADPERRAYLPPGGPVPSAEAGFTSVHFLRVVHPVGQQVVIRSLITAAAPGRHWLLEGEHSERAVPVSIDQMTPRIDELVTPPVS
jgi:hypothetical protein